jgi:protein dithiol oxidoreductase (disulfide-forming)
MRFLKLFGCSSLALLAVLTGAAQAQMPIADKEYKLITPPQRPANPKKIEVIEFFSYACPHCADFEAPLQDWLKRKPKDVDYKAVPVVFRDNWKPLAKLYYTLETMGLLDNYHDKVFDAIHKEGQQLFDDQAIIKWAAQQGINADKFTEIYNSFGIDAKVQRAMAMGRAYGVQFTPSLAVNGKYYTGPSMATGPCGGVDLPHFFDVLDQLIGMERKRAGAPAAGKTKG